MSYAHGKLLLTGEYFVLDGAWALAVPTRRGQRLTTTPLPTADTLKWTSRDHEGHPWFEATWQWHDGQPALLHTNDPATAERVGQLLNAVMAQNPAAWALHLGGKHLAFDLEFPRDWGLGSSSTLVCLLAQCTHTDPYVLLEATFGGSGYDIACATANAPLLYQRTLDGKPNALEFDWEPAYREHLHFVYLGQKQDSRDGIRRYRELCGVPAVLVDEVNNLTQSLVEARTLDAAAQVAAAHEALVASVLDIPRVQAQRFADFPGVVKSLGAWGGDFALAFSPLTAAQTVDYFHAKGCPVVVGYGEMVLG